MQKDLLIPSPLQRIQNPDWEQKQVKVWVKREDLIHETVSGNKWRKLKYNLAQVKEEGYEGVLTFGGAFSNHIHATAAACNLYNIKCVGIIRGEYDPHNPTLQFAKAQGMLLYFVSRSAYRMKAESPEVINILNKYKNYQLVPEGGSNELALKGVEEIGNELLKQLALIPDYIIVAAGTGCTAAGLINAAHVKKEILVLSALKGDFLWVEIEEKLNKSTCATWSLLTNYHFGGYGKASEELIQYINGIKKELGIKLDPIYNGKSFYALNHLIASGRIEKGSRVVFIHTGGLQGIDGWNYRNKGRANRILY